MKTPKDEKYDDQIVVRCWKKDKASFEKEAKKKGVKSSILARLRLFGDGKRA